MSLKSRPDSYTLARAVIVTAIRNEEFRRIAYDQVLTSMWHERECALVWQAIVSLMRDGVSITDTSLKAAIANIEDDMLGDADRQSAIALVEFAYSMDEGEVNKLYDYVIQVFWRFIAERHVIPMVHTAAALDEPDEVAAYIEGIMESLTKARSLSRDTSSELDLDLPGYLSGSIRSTGLPFLDYFMEGYPEMGELHGLLGPTGAGKTTLGVQIATAAVTNVKPRGLWFYVTYETSAREIQSRMFSTAAKVDRYTIARCPGIGTKEGREMLSTRGRLKDYEIRLFGSTDIPGELERLIDAQSRLKPYIRIIEGMKRGSRLHDPAVLRSAIIRTSLKADIPVGGVVVDYVGAAAIKMQDDAPDIPFRNLISRFEQEMLEFAEEFHCPVWLLHQITGSSLSTKPATPLTHDKAHENKSFANPLSYCFCLGTMDPVTMCVLLNCSKSRRSRKKPPIVLKMDDHIAEYRQTDDYVPNRLTGQIVPRGEL